MSKLNWTKWGRAFWASVARHVGTAGLTWLSLGVKDGRINWRDLWVALLVGGILPSAFTFLQATPLPEEDAADQVETKV